MTIPWKGHCPTRLQHGQGAESWTQAPRPTVSRNSFMLWGHPSLSPLAFLRGTCVSSPGFPGHNMAESHPQVICPLKTEPVVRLFCRPLRLSPSCKSFSLLLPPGHTSKHRTNLARTGTRKLNMLGETQILKFQKMVSYILFILANVPKHAELSKTGARRWTALACSSCSMHIW